MTKKVAIIIQRFGQEVIGGAEHHAMTLARKLQTDLGWDIDIITTTSLDYLSWKNHFPPGTSQEGELRISRFNSLNGRSPLFKLHNQLMKLLVKVYAKIPFFKYLFLPMELFWFLLQGPICLDLISHIIRKRNDYDQFIFFTYLYAPTMFGIWPVKNKAILIPTAHDEPAFHFTMTSLLLQAPRLIFCNSIEEAKLVGSKLPAHNQNKVKVVGIGVDRPHNLPGPQDTEHPKFLLYLGRIGKGKGIDQLIQTFLESEVSCELWLAGKVDAQFNIVDHPRIKILGIISEQQKWDLLAKCACIINPSAHESLSLIVLEGIAAEKPIIVNGNSPVLLHYSEVTESVFPFHGDTPLKKVLKDVLSENWNSNENLKKLERSKEWLSAHYSWNKILEVFRKNI